MQHEGDELTRQLVEVGDHQQQTLRRGKRGRQRAGLQGAVDGGDGTPFRLHLDNPGHIPHRFLLRSLDQADDCSAMAELGVMG